MKTRTRRRPSTRSADQEAIVCPTASKIKPSASPLIAMMETRALPLGAIHMQLTKLKVATAAQIKACHQRNLREYSKNAGVNSQSTTTLPVDSAINGACATKTGVVAPIPEVTACAAEPSASAIASRPATTLRKSRSSDADSTRSRATVPARKARSRAKSDINFGCSTSPGASPIIQRHGRVTSSRPRDARRAAALRLEKPYYRDRCSG